MEDLIRNVMATLDRVEVRGRDNIARMNACMQALEKIADALKHNREAMQKEGGKPK